MRWWTLFTCALVTRARRGICLSYKGQGVERTWGWWKPVPITWEADIDDLTIIGDGLLMMMMIIIIIIIFLMILMILIHYLYIYIYKMLMMIMMLVMIQYFSVKMMYWSVYPPNLPRLNSPQPSLLSGLHWCALTLQGVELKTSWSFLPSNKTRLR